MNYSFEPSQLNDLVIEKIQSYILLNKDHIERKKDEEIAFELDNITPPILRRSISDHHHHDVREVFESFFKNNLRLAIYHAYLKNFMLIFRHENVIYNISISYDSRLLSSESIEKNSNDTFGTVSIDNIKIATRNWMKEYYNKRPYKINEYNDGVWQLLPE